MMPLRDRKRIAALEEKTFRFPPCYDHCPVSPSSVGGRSTSRREGLTYGRSFPQDEMLSRRVMALLSVCVGVGLAAPVLKVCVAPSAPKRWTRAEIAEAIGRSPIATARIVGFGPRALSQPACRHCQELEGELRASGDTSSEAVAGLALLALRAGRFLDAIELLERAAALDPGRASLQSDLGAAYLARYDAGEADATDVVSALAALDAATALDPALAEARYNLALALERLALEEQAVKAWKAYLRLDAKSEWTAAVRSHLRRLEGTPAESDLWERALLRLDRAAGRVDHLGVLALVTRFPQRARLHAEDELVSWGDAWLCGDRGAAAVSLATAREIGISLAQATGDRMVAAAVGAVDGSIQSGDLPRLATLARGHHEFGAGQKLYQDDDRAALVHFERARRLLAAGGSAFRLWAAVKAGYCEVFGSRLRDAERTFRTLIEGEDLTPFPVLHGRAETGLGIAYGRATSYGASLSHYQQARRLLLPTGETENVAALETMIGENLGLQGQPDEGWQHRRRALWLLRGDRQSIYFHNTLLDAVAAELSLHRPGVALYFENEAIDALEAAHDPLLEAESRQQRSAVLRQLGREGDAESDLLTAGGLLQGTSDRQRLERIKALLAVDRGSRDLLSAPGRAVESLTQSIDYWRQTGEGSSLPELYEKRALARTKLGDRGGAEEDFRASLAEIEAQSSRVQADARVPFLDRMHSAFTEAAVFEAETLDRPAVAFADAERFRVLELSGASEPIRGRQLADGELVTEIQVHLAPRQALVEYLIGPEASLACVVRHEILRCVTLREGERRLAAEVAQFRGLILGRAAAAAIARPGSHLYDVLIRPLLPFIGGSRTLLIVRDGVLDGLPFSALVDAREGRYLVRRWAFLYPPNAKLFVRASDRLAGVSFAHAAAAVVGDPVVNSVRFPKLRDLPAALREAREVAAIYGGAEPLTGERATPAAVLAAAAASDVLHVASHALDSPADPSQSSLVLAPEPGRPDGQLLAEDLERAPLSRLRLAVLAGCHTAGARRYLSRGAEGLVRALLIAGVPAVVASQWEVSDAASSRLLTEFHRRLHAGDGLAEALRNAQLRALEEADATPASWASFELIGSSDERGSR